MPISRRGMRKVSGATVNAPSVFDTTGQVKAPNINVNFLEKQAVNFCVENRTDDPGAPATGRLWLRTDL